MSFYGHFLLFRKNTYFVKIPGMFFLVSDDVKQNYCDEGLGVSNITRKIELNYLNLIIVT